MSPRADAVRFVNHEPSEHLPMDQVANNAPDLASHREHLRSDVNDLGTRFGLGQLLVRNPFIGRRQITGIRNRGNCTLDKMSSLIIDKRDQWRNDKCHTTRFAARADSWQLVCKSVELDTRTYRLDSCRRQ